MGAPLEEPSSKLHSPRAKSSLVHAHSIMRKCGPELAQMPLQTGGNTSRRLTWKVHRLLDFKFVSSMTIGDLCAESSSFFSALPMDAGHRSKPDDRQPRT
jgi:hypothetical protein